VLRPTEFRNFRNDNQLGCTFLGLLLTREKGKGVLVGEHIEVTVEEFGGKHATIDIRALADYGGNRSWNWAIGDSLRLGGKDVVLTLANITHGTGQSRSK